jgi:hypothetical protein
VFCRELVSELRAARAAADDLPRVVLVHQGTVEQGDAFLESRWPEVSAIADPGRVLYAAFGLERGRLAQVLGPRVLLRGMSAALRGNGIGKPVGDLWQMPGAFVIHRSAIVWSHVAHHVGDQPNLDQVRTLMAHLEGGHAAAHVRAERSAELVSTA